MQVQAHERGKAVEQHEKAVADPCAGAHGDLGHASRSSRSIRVPV
jgi:hypothetical protein